MERVAHETEEDYQQLIKILQGLNVKVIRPEFNSDDFVDPDTGKFYKPPMYPRDDMIMIGDTFVILHCRDRNDPYENIINHVRAQGNKIIDSRDSEHQLLKILAAPCINRFGKDLYFDVFSDNPNNTDEQIEQAYEHLKTVLGSDYRYSYIPKTGGHTDGTFCIANSKLVISTHDTPVDYIDTFGVREVAYITDPGYEYHGDHARIIGRRQTHPKWWVQNQSFSQELTEYVNYNIGHWLGNAGETIFNVNMLVVDEKNIICSMPDPQLEEVFKRFNITPHYVDLRSRYFFDGGIHCSTLDLNRTGPCEDYFGQ